MWGMKGQSWSGPAGLEETAQEPPRELGGVAHRRRAIRLRPEEQAAIRRLAAWLVKDEGASSSSIIWPEDAPKEHLPDAVLQNRPCDAIIDLGQGPIAIEHTSIMAYVGQGKWAGQYEPIRSGIKKAIASMLTNGMACHLAVPDREVHGIPWADFGERIGTEIMNAHTLDSLGQRHTIRMRLDGDPYEVSCRLSPSDIPDVYMVMRPISPVEHDLSSLIKKALDDKCPKLRLYKERGYQTILLIEERDWANTNPEMVQDAFTANRGAYAEDPLPNRVYLLFTATSEIWRLR